MMTLPSSLLRHIDLCQRELPVLTLPENYNPPAELEEYTISAADDELVKIPVWLNGSIYDLGDLLDVYNADKKIDYEKIKDIPVNASLKIRIEIIIPFGDKTIAQALGVADIQPLTRSQLDICKRNLAQIAQGIEKYNTSVSTPSAAAAPVLRTNAAPLTKPLSSLPIDEWSAPPKMVAKTDEQLARDLQAEFDSNLSPSAAAAATSKYTGQMFSPPTSFVAKPFPTTKKIEEKIRIAVYGSIASCISKGYREQEFPQNYNEFEGVNPIINQEDFSLLTKPLTAYLYLVALTDVERFTAMVEAHLRNKNAVILCLNLEINENELRDTFIKQYHLVSRNISIFTEVFIFAYNSTNAKMPDFLNAYALPCFIINPYTGAGVNEAFDSVIETVAKQAELQSSHAQSNTPVQKNDGGCRIM